MLTAFLVLHAMGMGAAGAWCVVSNSISAAVDSSQRLTIPQMLGIALLWELYLVGVLVSKWSGK